MQIVIHQTAQDALSTAIVMEQSTRQNVNVVWYVWKGYLSSVPMHILSWNLAY